MCCKKLLSRPSYLLPQLEYRDRHREISNEVKTKTVGKRRGGTQFWTINETSLRHDKVR